jgi:hypothetical protein
MQAEILLDYIKEALATPTLHVGSAIGVRVSAEAMSVIDEIGIEKAGVLRIFNGQYIELDERLVGYDMDVTETVTKVVCGLYSTP